MTKISDEEKFKKENVYLGSVVEIQSMVGQFYCSRMEVRQNGMAEWQEAKRQRLRGR